MDDRQLKKVFLDIAVYCFLSFCCSCCFCTTKQQGPPPHTRLLAARFSSFVAGTQNIDACQNLLHFVNMRQQKEKELNVSTREIHPDTP